MVVVARKLPDGAGNGHRQFAARVHPAEEHQRHSAPGLLPKIPALDDSGCVGFEFDGGKRAAIDEQHRDRFAGGEHGISQLVLPAGEVQCVGIAEVLFAPRFAVQQFVVPENQHDGVALPRQVHGLGDQLLIVGGIAQDRVFVDPPVARLVQGEPASLRVADIDLVPRELPEALQHAHPLHWHGGIAAEMNVGRVGSDDGERFDLRRIKRQHARLVLQEHHGFAGSLQRQPPVGGIGGEGVELRHIGIRIFQQPARQFDPEDIPGGAVQIAFRHLSRPDRFRESPKGVFAAQIVVEACADRQDAGLIRPGRRAVAFVHDVETATVTHHKSVEAPFAAQDLGQQLPVHVIWHTVPFVVGGHDRLGMAAFDGNLERVEMAGAKLAFRVVDRRDVPPALGLAVAGEVFQGDGDMVRIDGEVPALEPSDRGQTHAGDEIRIFAVTLLGPAPARIAREIEHRREHLAGAPGAGVEGGDSEHLLNERRIPGAAKRDRLWKAGGAPGHETVQCLAEEEDRDAEPRLLRHVALEAVEAPREILRRNVEAGLLEGREVEIGAGAELELRGIGPGDKIALVVPRQGIFPLARLELRHFLFQAHPGEKIVEPLFDRQGRVLVGLLPVGEAGEEQNDRAEGEVFHESGWVLDRLESIDNGEAPAGSPPKAQKAPDTDDPPRSLLRGSSLPEAVDRVAQGRDFDARCGILAGEAEFCSGEQLPVANGHRQGKLRDGGLGGRVEHDEQDVAAAGPRIDERIGSLPGEQRHEFRVGRQAGTGAPGRRSRSRGSCRPSIASVCGRRPSVYRPPRFAAGRRAAAFRFRCRSR